MFKEIFHRFVPACLRFELRYPSRVEDAPAVEDKAAAVAAVVRWVYLLVRKAVDVHHQRGIGIRLYGLEAADDFVLHHQPQQPFEFR